MEEKERWRTFREHPLHCCIEWSGDAKGSNGVDGDCESGLDPISVLTVCVGCDMRKVIS